MIQYAQMIREEMARLGRVGAHDPALVEGWMRVEYGTLDHLSPSKFRSEVKIALGCCDADPQASRELAESYGLKVMS